MIFWITILLSVCIGWVATRIGFYETLVYTVNITLSIYLALFITPFVVTHVPAATEIAVGLPLTLAALATDSFLVLFGASFLLFTGQFKVTFPKLLDILLSGIIGCGSGFFLVSFMCIILSVTPYAMTEALVNTSNLETNTGVLCHGCDSIHALVGRNTPLVSTRDIIDWLIENKSSPQDHRSEPDPNKPPSSPVAPGSSVPDHS